MPRFSWNIALLFAIGAVSVTPAACSCGGDTNDTGSFTNSGGSAGSAANASGGNGTGGNGGGECFPSCTGGAAPGTLKVVPATATIDVVNGVAMPFDFDAEVDGDTVLPGSWIVDLSSIANVDTDGIVTATGVVGGEVKVQATYNGLKASGTLRVNIKNVIDPNNTPPAEKEQLRQATTPDASVVWAYPYDRTVFPKGLLAPELMWNNSTAGDKYYVKVTGQFVELEFFTTADPPSRFAPDDPSWKVLTESGQGGPVDLHVARLSGANATVLVDHKWTIANGSMRGTVYYWSNNLGRVLRIKPGATAPEDFLPPPPPGSVDSCSTCHVVSADGSTLVLGGDINLTTYDLLTNTQIFSLGPSQAGLRRWAMPALSPNGQVLVENNAALPGPPGGSDGMWDAKTGQKLANTGLEGILLDMPAFAPDGTKIAFVDHTSKGLSVFNFDVATTSASNQVDLVPGGTDPNLNCIAFPSVSPDAKRVVYHRGSYPGSLDTRTGPGNLYLASIDSPGTEVRLAEINGDNYPFAAGNRDLNYNYEPTFAPLNSGGYMWVVFTSRRTYGNRLTNVAYCGDRCGTKQLWVAAIDQNPQPGQDPSHPAFHITGQDENLNMRGFWALDPCKQVGAACETGSQCCNQNCDQGICTEPDPNECSENGNHCDKTADCCDSQASCINHICSEGPPG